MFEHFTEDARTVILEATAEAMEREDDHVGCEHLLLGLLRDGTGPAATVLAERAVTAETVRATLDELVGRRPTVAPDEALATIGIDVGQVRTQVEATFGPGALAAPPPPYDAGAKEALHLAVTEAGARLVGPEHELLGVAQVSDGLATRILGRLGVDLTDLVDEVRARFP
ncbi:MAG: Clp protease ClpX [Actinomycetia bacterium]|nr:Clp protease ClpX [Actinomycetes bacterium]